MPIDEAGHGWMAYGSLDAQGVWHFDKPRISQALESAMAGCRLCPVFDRARVPPARWSRAVAVALCMLALCMLGLGVFPV
jgi:hypothetical protein